jgi:DNA polymerase III alpha subunit (gram-positive type)
MRYDKIVCFDLETTGFSKTKHEILEIGAIAYFPVSGEKRYFSLLVQVKELTKEISELTGITSLENAIPLRVALRSFKYFINEDAENVLLVGHNVKAFDMPFLSVNGCDLSKYAVWDTLEVERERKQKKNALADVCKRYDLEQKQEHRALDDAKAAFEVFLKQIAKDRKMLKFC